jgi:uncharacterized protein YajQ (UPF0234 family)
MPSFDVVSKVDWAEVTNALDQASRELSQRFDFKGTDADIERTDDGVVVRANSEERVRAALDVFEQKLVRRKVSLKHLEKKDPEPGPKGSSRQRVLITEGIETEKAKEIVKLKVQAAIQEKSVRITGKKRDDLQSAIQLLKGADELGLDLQFQNFRD